MYNFIALLTRSGMLMLFAAIAVWRVRDASFDTGRAPVTAKA